MSGLLNIDWDFIARHEGPLITTAYVPKSGHSGVTVATGIDLGQRSPMDIARWSISDELKHRLSHYCYACGAAAQELLRNSPLRITDDDARRIDQAASEPIFNALQHAFDHACGEGAFAKLPRNIQTAIASVGYQYGPNLPRRTPKFWRLVTAQDWPGTVTELRNFGDAYKTRRNNEADLIEDCLQQGDV